MNGADGAQGPVGPSGPAGSGGGTGGDAYVSTFNPATGQQAAVTLPGGDGSPAAYLLTAAVALSNTASSPALANCNLKAGLFQVFGNTSVTVPPDGTGNPAVAHAQLLGAIVVEPGDAVNVMVECFSGSGAQLLTATITALRVAALIVQ